MSIIQSNFYSNISPYPKSWYWQNMNWSAKTVSVAADRYKLTSPSAIQVDVGGLSLTNEVAQELDLSIDATWDFGQSAVGTWTAGHSYSVGDWVRPSSANLADGSLNTSTAYATPAMLSNTIPSPFSFITNITPVTAPGYEPFRAFNNITGNAANCWVSVDGFTSGYLTFDFGLGFSRVINKYRFYPQPNLVARMPSGFTLKASNDNSNWVTLDTQTSQSFSDNVWSSFYTFQNSTAYRYYRFDLTKSVAGYLSIDEIHLVAAPSLIYRCTTQGTSLSAEPTWGTTVGGTTAESGGPTWTCYYDDTIASNRAGVDYFLYSCVGSSTVPVLLASRNSTYPHGYDATNSRKIAGFHCLCASVGTISGHDLTDYVTGDVLPTSVWDLNKKSLATNGNIGQVYDDDTLQWVGIYPTSGSVSVPTIVYGGTILVSTDWNNAVDAGKVLGMRLPTDVGFQSLAAGSNEQTNIYGSAAPSPFTSIGYVDTASRRMISNIGVESCCGLIYSWLDEQSYRFGGAAAHTHTITTAGATSGAASVDLAPAWSWQAASGSKGSIYKQGTVGDVKMVSSGNWDKSTESGSRGRLLHLPRWSTESSVGFRLTANSIEK